MKYKESYYNHFFKMRDGFFLAYNSLSNSLARIDNIKFIKLNQILQAPNDGIDGIPEMEKLRNDLLQGSFLIEEDLDELELIKMRNKIGRFSTDILKLTIAPTLACNFKCSYCFENRSTETMNGQIEEDLLQFIDLKLKISKKLAITWFGGEPSLTPDIIERLTARIKTLCEKYSVILLPMSIITNGFLLNKEIALRLKNIGVTSAQVTLDGPADVHDKRRILINGKETFQTILNNISEVMELLRISIRINIDKENMNSLEPLFDIFKEKGFFDKAPFYFGQTQAQKDTCADVASVCIGTKEHSKTVIRLMDIAIKKGYYNTKYPVSSHFGYCTADSVNGFVIAPSGYIFKCWSEISAGLDKSVGHVSHKETLSLQLNNLIKYMNWDPFKKKECKKCKLLPICAGGCPYIYFEKLHPRNCVDFKFGLKKMMIQKYEEIKNKSQK